MDDIDMSLDDIISRQRGNGAFGRKRGVMRSGRVRNRNVLKRNRFLNRSNDNESESQRGKWTHDLYDEDTNGKNRSSNKLLISNLEYGVSDGDLRELFAEFGSIRRLSVHYDKSGRSCGTAEIIFDNPRVAMNALNEYNGVLLDGRAMIIQKLFTDSQSPVYNNQYKANSTNINTNNNNSNSLLGPLRTRNNQQSRWRQNNDNENWRDINSNKRIISNSTNQKRNINNNRRSLFNRRKQNGKNVDKDISATALDSQLDSYNSLKQGNGSSSNEGKFAQQKSLKALNVGSLNSLPLNKMGASTSTIVAARAILADAAAASASAGADIDAISEKALNNLS